MYVCLEGCTGVYERERDPNFCCFGGIILEAYVLVLTLVHASTSNLCVCVCVCAGEDVRQEEDLDPS